MYALYAPHRSRLSKDYLFCLLKVVLTLLIQEGTRRGHMAGALI